MRRRGPANTETHVRTVRVTTDSVTLEASSHDRVSQVIRYQQITVGEAGAWLYPIPMRYARPGELDPMARFAGLTLREHWSCWDHSPFTASSSSDVLVYAHAFR